jgi:serine/threonine protein kinase
VEEVGWLKQLRNCNLLAVLGTTVTREAWRETKEGLSPTLVHDYCARGSLRASLYYVPIAKRIEESLHQQQVNAITATDNNPDLAVTPLSLKRKYVLLSGIAFGLNCLHNRGVPHLSLSSSRVLLDDNMTPLLGGYEAQAIARALGFANGKWRNVNQEVSWRHFCLSVVCLFVCY